MSLEEALDRNTKAVEKHTAVLEAVLKKGATGAAAAAAPKTADKPAATTTAPATAPKTATTKATTPKPASGKKGAASTAASTSTEPKAMSPADMKKACGDFLGVDNDEDARNLRREFLGGILAHLGVKVTTEIAEEARPRVVAAIEAYKANGGTVADLEAILDGGDGSTPGEEAEVATGQSELDSLLG